MQGIIRNSNHAKNILLKKVNKICVYIKIKTLKMGHLIVVVFHVFF